MPDNFIEIPFTIENLDRYYVRASIKKAMESKLSLLTGSLLDIGCGKMPYKEFILKNSPVEKYTGLDIENAKIYDTNVKPDFTWDGIKMPFENNSFHTTFATEVLEHCPDPKIILNEVYRVMRNEGCFFFTVPFLWPLHEVPNDEYRYTPFALERLLQDSGFRSIEIKATGGWHASMAQMLGLWVRRAPMSEKKRSMLSKILKPVIKKLIHSDKYSSIDFKEGQMITGLYGIAYK
jgi:ubiquinone/menaquinone biosynthesis C-methylase UbiE